MTLRINIHGGTGAGRKQPLREAGKHWRCRCLIGGEPMLRPGYLKNCPECKATRPDV